MTMELLDKVELSEENLGLDEADMDKLIILSIDSGELSQLPIEQQLLLGKLDYIPDDEVPDHVQRRWLPHMEPGVEFLTFVGDRTNISVPYRLQSINLERGTVILVNLNNTLFNATVEGRMYRWVYPELSNKSSKSRKKVKHEVGVSDEGDETTVSITVKSRKYDSVEVSFAEGMTTTELTKLIKQQLTDAGWNPNTAISRAQSIAKREAKAGRAVLTRRGKNV